MDGQDGDAAQPIKHQKSRSLRGVFIVIEANPRTSSFTIIKLRYHSCTIPKFTQLRHNTMLMLIQQDNDPSAGPRLM